MATIVVGVDGSPASAQALAWAAAAARREGAKLEVIGAWSFPALAALPFSDRTLADCRHETAALVERTIAASEVDAHTQPLHWEAVQGEPADVLLAAAHDADLLVVGTRGTGGFGSLALGSVARRVLRRAERPVAVVPARWNAVTPRAADAPVVVGVDAGGASRRAVEVAAEHARRLGTRCIAVHACAPMGTPTVLMAPAIDDIEAAARAMLDAELAAADTAGVTVEARVVFDSPSWALVELSEQAALVVVGRHHHLVVGSVADACASHASCPVLVVPA